MQVGKGGVAPAYDYLLFIVVIVLMGATKSLTVWVHLVRVVVERIPGSIVVGVQGIGAIIVGASGSHDYFPPFFASFLACTA